jgi:hypothetical protein
VEIARAVGWRDAGSANAVLPESRTARPAYLESSSAEHLWPAEGQDTNGNFPSLRRSPLSRRAGRDHSGRCGRKPLAPIHAEPVRRASAEGRAGIGEFDGGLPRAESEARAFACCVAEWLNRNPVRSPPGRCLGCGNGDHAHDPLLPFGIESTGHAWLHSLCWSAWYAGVEAVAALANLGIHKSRKDQGRKEIHRRESTVIANDPDDRKGALKNLGGSQSDHWNNLSPIRPCRHFGSKRGRRDEAQIEEIQNRRYIPIHQPLRKN